MREGKRLSKSIYVCVRTRMRAYRSTLFGKVGYTHLALPAVKPDLLSAEMRVWALLCSMPPPHFFFFLLLCFRCTRIARRAVSVHMANIFSGVLENYYEMHYCVNKLVYIYIYYKCVYVRRLSPMSKLAYVCLEISGVVMSRRRGRFVSVLADCQTETRGSLCSSSARNSDRELI